jgi:hypothetical protein
VAVADSIVCVDCGGSCHRMPLEPPELGWAAGDVVAYRCRDCNDMWYLELHEDDLVDGAEGDEPPSWPS